MTTIITKHGSGQPAAGQLSEGELAVDLTNKELYTKSGSAVIKIGGTGGGETGTFTDLTATSSFTSPGIDDTNNPSGVAITIDSNKNVGIGTDNPFSNLSVVGATGAGYQQIKVRQTDTAADQRTGIMFAEHATGSQGFGIGGFGSTTYNRLFIGGGANGMDAATEIRFSTAASVGTNIGTERMRIDSTGNVGIGESSPQTSLHIQQKTDSSADGIRLSRSNGLATYTQWLDGATWNLGYSNPATTDPSFAAITVNAVGNLGIGKTPTESLRLEALAPTGFSVGSGFYSETAQSTITFSDSNTTAAYKVRIGSEGDDLLMFAGGSEAVRIDSSGNVGIGTTTPTASTVVIKGDDYTGAPTVGTPGTLSLYSGSAPGSGGSISFGAIQNPEGFAAIKGNLVSGTDNTRGSLDFYTRNDSTLASMAHRMRIQASGSVAIGTGGGVTSADTKLQVNASSSTLQKIAAFTNENMSFSGAAGAYITVGDGATVSRSLDLGMNMGSANTWDAHLRVNEPNAGVTIGTSSQPDAVRIDNSGSLLIGASATPGSTGQSLHVEGSTGRPGMSMVNTGATAGKWRRLYTGANNSLYITDNQNLGVALSDGATTWIAASDESLKENISDIGPVLDTIKDFRCVNYSLKATESEAADKVGFIAQDWKDTFPSVVAESEDGTLAMKYTETIPVLLKAIQEQQAMIETLQAEVASLKGA